MPQTLKRNPNLVAIFPWGKVGFVPPLKTFKQKNHKGEGEPGVNTTDVILGERKGGLLENVNKEERVLLLLLIYQNMRHAGQ